jgi:hypothetical protein
MTRNGYATPPSVGLYLLAIDQVSRLYHFFHHFRLDVAREPATDKMIREFHDYVQ